MGQHWKKSGNREKWRSKDGLKIAHMGQLNDVESISPTGITEPLDWSYSEDNQGNWTQKTMISLWFDRTVGKGPVNLDVRTYHGRTDFVTNTLMKVQHVAVSENSVHNSCVPRTVIWT